MKTQSLNILTGLSSVNPKNITIYMLYIYTYVLRALKEHCECMLFKIYYST